MATLKLFFDTRKAKKDGTYPLKLKLFHQNKARYISLNHSFKKHEWVVEDCKVKSSYTNSARINVYIRKKLSEASIILLEVEDKIEDLNIDELKNHIISRLYGENKVIKKKEYLFSYTQSIIVNLIKAKRIGSANSYKATLRSFQSYLDDKDIALTKVDYKFLLDYQAYCQNKGLRTNSIGVYLRTLRAIINRAIDEELLPYSKYPFRKFRIKTERTEKRAISKKEIMKVMNLKLKKRTPIWNSKNYFVFMFNMRGMNFIDLAYLKKENLRGDRIVYKRKKTGKLYNIKITAKAQEILSYYLFNYTRKYIFPIMPEDIDNIEQEREIYTDKRKQFNKYLKQIAKKCKIEANLTSYVSRHTWASLAKFSGVSHAIIGESLGHSDLKTTETYLANFDTKTLDDANDKIVGL